MKRGRLGRGRTAHTDWPFSSLGLKSQHLGFAAQLESCALFELILWPIFPCLNFFLGIFHVHASFLLEVLVEQQVEWNPALKERVETGPVFTE